METFVAKPHEVHRKWVLVDGSGQTLGRLASRVAEVLRGKHKPIFTPHVDCGDHVVIINAEKVRVTGRKASLKNYYHHTGYPGGLKSESYAHMMKRSPEKVLEKAIWGMMPHNKLGRKMIKKLKIYAGSEHPHTAQKPEKIELS